MRLNAIWTLTIGLCIGLSSSAFGQDLMARQAAVDRKMKAVDSAIVQRLMPAEPIESFADVFSSDWTNRFTGRNGDAVPDSVRIDLRGFHMPTPSTKVTSGFGYRRAFRRNHYGLDVKVYIGDTIKAAFNGTVRVKAYEAKGYGYYIVIRHSNGLETIYGHLSKQLVEENQNVRAGEPIGLGGNTGHSTGSHLHFETRLVKGNEPIDPALLFDFEKQDVTNDYYVYRKNPSASSSLLAAMKANQADDASDDEASQAVKTKPASSVAQKPAKIHKVKSGENLYAIAKKHGITVERLCSINRISQNARLRPGQILRYQ